MFDDLMEHESPVERLFDGFMRPRSRFTVWRFLPGLTPQVLVIIVAVLIQRDIELDLQITRDYMNPPATADAFLFIGEVMTAIVITILLLRRVAEHAAGFALALVGEWVYTVAAIVVGSVILVLVTGRGLC